MTKEISFRAYLSTSRHLFRLNEGEEVYIFTENNVEEFTKHYNDQLISTLTESLETKKEMIELMNLIKDLDEVIKESKSDKEKLQMLNKQLSETIIQLMTEYT